MSSRSTALSHYGPLAYEVVTIDGETVPLGLVKDIAVHPGEDSTFDRQWGGPLPASKSALTASGAVGSAGARKYYGYIVTTALSAAAITIYDNTSGAGTVIDVIPASTAAGTRGVLPAPVSCTTGIYASFGGTGTVLFLYS